MFATITTEHNLICFVEITAKSRLLTENIQMNIKPSDRLKRKSQFSNEIISPKKPRTMESKINNLVESVSSQGILGRLVVIDNNIDTSYVILQNALMMLNLKPQFTKIDDPTSK